MFETTDFRNLLTSTVANEAARNDMEKYETDVVDFLQRQAAANEDVLMDRELRKSASERRGLPDALQSARELVREAARIASLEKATVLRRSHIQEAYERKYCQVWPFCRG